MQELLKKYILTMKTVIIIFNPNKLFSYISIKFFPIQQ